MCPFDLAVNTRFTVSATCNARLSAMLSDPSAGAPPPRGRASVSDAAWSAYLQNCGVWAGRRALCNARGKVLVDIPTRVHGERFKTPDGDDCVLWRIQVETAAGKDEAEEEWSREELAEFGALSDDGSFSTGAVAFVGERFSVDQCVFATDARVRSTFAYDWEGRLTGVVASRERKIPEEAIAREQRLLAEGDAATGETAAAGGLLAAPSADEQQSQYKIEPAAWRSPTVLLDYSLGIWHGRGVVVDVRTYMTRTVSTVLQLKMEADDVLLQRSQLSIGKKPGLVVESSAKLDANTALFAEANLQLMLLPGGVTVSCPIQIWAGIAFTLEVAFLVRPDSRKRVLRCYDENCNWIQTVFVSELRVG